MKSCNEDGCKTPCGYKPYPYGNLRRDDGYLSAVKSNGTIDIGTPSVTTISGWDTPSLPYYVKGTNWNELIGIYTVPETGKYQLQAVINYETTAAISVNLTPNDLLGFFAIRQNSKPIATGNLPLLNISFANLAIKAVLGSGQVIMETDVFLEKGDLLDVSYVGANSGFSINIPINLGNSSNPSFFTVQKLSFK